MTARAAAVLAVALLFLPLAEAVDFAPLTARLEWRQAVGLGDVAVAGPLETLLVPIDREAKLPEASLFLLEAESVLIDAETRSYVTPIWPAPEVSKDMSTRRSSVTLESPKLRLVDLREQVSLMVVHAMPGADAPTGSLLARELSVTGTDGFQQQFYPYDDPFQKTHEGKGAALALVASSLGDAVVLEGDFTLYLWDIDVSDAANPSRVFFSGRVERQEVGQTGATPEGVVTEADEQFLTLTVTGGRLTFSFPGRALQAFADPASSRIQTTGSWDLVGASGTLALAGNAKDVRAEDVHLAGDFVTTFDDAFPVASVWEGQAVQASTASEELSPVAPAAAVATRYPGWALWLGLGLLGLGGLIALAWMGLRARAARLQEAVAASEADEEGEELVVKAIGLMEQGQAAQVIASLEPTFNAADTAAPVKAYLLSLAHLREGRPLDGVRWILKAIEAFPDFTQEVRENEAFAPIRSDPRIRRLLNPEGVTGYV